MVGGTVPQDAPTPGCFDAHLLLHDRDDLHRCAQGETLGAYRATRGLVAR